MNNNTNYMSQSVLRGRLEDGKKNSENYHFFASDWKMQELILNGCLVLRKLRA